MKIKPLLAGTAVFALTLGASAYSSMFGKSEIVHFWVAVPSGYVARPVTLYARECPGDCSKCDRAKSESGAKTAPATGGQRVMMTPINIDLDRRGFLKRWLQPAVEAISTHWIYNVGEKPVRIRMELARVGIPVKWEVNANFPYDQRTHTFLQPLAPGASIRNLGIDWTFQIPPAALQGPARMLYEGGLRLSDADTGEMLTFIPIRIGRGLPAAPRRSHR